TERAWIAPPASRIVRSPMRNAPPCASRRSRSTDTTSSRSIVNRRSKNSGREGLERQEGQERRERRDRQEPAARQGHRRARRSPIRCLRFCSAPPGRAADTTTASCSLRPGAPRDRSAPASDVPFFAARLARSWADRPNAVDSLQSLVQSRWSSVLSLVVGRRRLYE